MLGEAPSELFAPIDEEGWLWVHTEGRRWRPAVAASLPPLPRDEEQVRYCGLAGDAALRQAWAFYRLVLDVAEPRLGPARTWRAVLDFGCGWGRVLRLFLKHVPSDRLWGVDCLQEAIRLCGGDWARFHHIAPRPPTTLPDATFDLIYAYSVFSHLSEEAHWAWLREFRRLLRPGGLLVVTTRPRRFIEWCAQVRAWSPLPAWAKGTAAAFPEARAWLARYDAGEYCHVATGGGEGLDASFFGETCIPETYVRRRWPELLEILDVVADQARCEQDVIVARSPNRRGEPQRLLAEAGLTDGQESRRREILSSRTPAKNGVDESS